MTPTADRDGQSPRVVIVGGGFAGVACAKALGDEDVNVLLLDRNNYHQFQPLLYQVASAALSPSDVGTPLRMLFRDHKTVDFKQADVVDVDIAGHTVRTADGQRYTGDYLVLAVGSQPNFFRTAGAGEHAVPLYSLLDAVRLRSRIFEVFDAADNDARLVDEGVLNFVIVGAGATGVEIAGALAELVNEVLPEQYHDLAVRAARVYVVDHGLALLGPFSPSAHDYAAKVLHRDGVQVKLGVGVKEITPSGVVLSDGSTIPTRCVIWAGGVQAGSLAGRCGLAQGRGGRINVNPDLTVRDAPGVYVLGDAANVPGPDGSALPQLGSVALQTGQWAAKNILADIAGEPRAGFHYHDKGIMAMIGRRAAVAEMGERRHELHGSIAFAAWLGVHAWLMSGVRSRVDAFVSWGWDYFSKNRAMALVDHRDVGTLDLDPQDKQTPPAPAPAAEKPPHT